MPDVKIDIQIFPPGHDLAPIHAPHTTDTLKGDRLKFKVRILDEAVNEVEIKFNELKLLDQNGPPPGGPPRGKKRKKKRPQLGGGGAQPQVAEAAAEKSRKINFKGKAEHSKPEDVVSDKYTITTFDDAGIEKDNLDPFIIICDP